MGREVNDVALLLRGRLAAVAANRKKMPLSHPGGDAETQEEVGDRDFPA